MLELGLIGRPLGHSRSPEFFANRFREAGIKGRYDLFPIECIDELPDLLATHPGLRGFNVTIPFKQEVMKYLDHVSPEAAAIHAVNTVSIEHIGDRTILTGHNTDFKGFADSLSPIVNRMDISGGNAALILGSGGAAQAVAFGLKRLDIPFTVVSRNPDTHNRCKASVHKVIRYDDLTSEMMDTHRIIVNCTPLGMWPNVDGCPDIPWDLLPDNAVCYDLVYNPPLTEFMKRGAERGAAVKNGLEMLHRQAEAAWEIWLR